MEKSGKEKERNNKFTVKMQKKLVVLYLCVLLAFAGLSARLMIINRDDGERYGWEQNDFKVYGSESEFGHHPE